MDWIFLLKKGDRRQLSNLLNVTEWANAWYNLYVHMFSPPDTTFLHSLIYILPAVGNHMPALQDALTPFPKPCGYGVPYLVTYFHY